MCQLLGMNCNTPTDIVFSFEGFRRRGGETDIHVDGFGIAFFEGKGIRIYQDDRPCASSPVADLVKAYQIKSKNVISHIRKATQGHVSLANTHPFMRELWGEYWLFAHNGHLNDPKTLFKESQGQYYRPVGTTDSEQAFCYILEHLRQRFNHKPTKEEIFREIQQLTEKIREAGIFNFILSNGEWMIAHSSTLLHYIIRQAPFGEATLLDDDVNIDFAAVTTPKDRVAVIATLPLTSNENWHQFATNELLMFEEGAVVLQDCKDPQAFMSVKDALALASAVGAAASSVI
ncbi:class II glutamine amidotransferase [Ignatzschineria rhizosphaerae]|uniref:Class II glutamine amidotransferase n=1 Tax=Ignatzschineria rhizosphaerae TaxID=2923279 RepID=A0ABY3XAV0_9GAMM|nr:class II glutamine amidotransferase [Ignatzschineria rhizosphaerae]UNM97083.1 class II glutamine amidotransferase [Ignatzschineria rhizosphaerae]